MYIINFHCKHCVRRVENCCSVPRNNIPNGQRAEDLFKYHNYNLHPMVFLPTFYSTEM